jgi:ATP-dependent helicase HrpB
MSGTNTILQAAPGSGKTTRLPPALMKHFDKKILVLEPRRVAALGASSRIAEEHDFELGKEVGYQVRFENKTTDQTKLIFMTEATMQKRLRKDPRLNDVALVILDEFHERSLNTDLALGLLLELQQLDRPDLKILVMSATLDLPTLESFLPGSKTLKVPGQIYPLEIEYSPKSQLLQTGPQFVDRVIDAIISVAKSKSNSSGILVFLPGVGEIRRVREGLEHKQFNRFVIEELHGQLSIQEQKKVLRTNPGPRIVLATNIAESSLTLDGVDCVIDCGLEKQSSFHTKSGLSRLEIQRISKFSAIQRAGRSARQRQGYTLRLWTKMDELSMPEAIPAEIHRSDLSESLLLLSDLGLRDFKGFSWFENPKADRLEKAESELRSLKAIDSTNSITSLGKKLLDWPLPLRLARVMEEGLVIDQAYAAILISLVLSERATVAPPTHLDCDLRPQIEDLHEKLKTQRLPNHQSMAYRQLKEICLRKGASVTEQLSTQSLEALLWSAFSDRVCRRRKANQPQALMRNGIGVALDTSSAVKKSDFFFALQVMDTNTAEAKVFVASPLSLEFLISASKDEVQLSKKLNFNPQTGELKIHEAKSLGILPLEDARVKSANAEEVAHLLPDLAAENFEWILQNNSALQEWWKRWQYYQSEVKCDDFNLKSALEMAASGESSLKALTEKNIIPFFEMALEEELKKDFFKQCPEEITTLKQRKFKIQYLAHQAPFVEVKIQELFGMKTHPTVFSGKIPVVLHLLGPNYRPVQVTSDLVGFWAKSYFEIRKELRIRYPKHPWPEDPTVELVLKPRGS